MSGLRDRRFAPPVDLSPESRQQIQQQARGLLLDYQDIVFAYAYGSFARGEPCRDLDVALYVTDAFHAPCPLELAGILQDSVGLEVDVILLNHAPIALQFAVFRDGQLLFSRHDELRMTLIERAGHRYWDYAHFRDLFLGVVGDRQESGG
jgi:hypothetical protein